MEARAAWVLGQPGNEDVRSVKALVSDANHRHLNDVRAQLVTVDDVVTGAGTRSFGSKSGNGTTARIAEYIAGTR